VFHVGSFPTLEADFDRDAAGYSPDRVDALVWAFSELLVTPMPSYAAYEIARERAEGGDRSVGPGAEHQRASAGGIDPLGTIVLDQAQDANTGAEALLGNFAMARAQRRP